MFSHINQKQSILSIDSFFNQHRCASRPSLYTPQFCNVTYLLLHHPWYILLIVVAVH